MFGGSNFLGVQSLGVYNFGGSNIGEIKIVKGQYFLGC